MESSHLVEEIESWIPVAILDRLDEPTAWIRQTISDLLVQLSVLKDQALQIEVEEAQADEEEAGESNSTPTLHGHIKEELLEFLFYHGMLPSYAFPTDVASFLIEEYSNRSVNVIEKPQQAIVCRLE